MARMLSKAREAAASPAPASPRGGFLLLTFHNKLPHPGVGPPHHPPPPPPRCCFLAVLPAFVP